MAIVVEGESEQSQREYCGVALEYRQAVGARAIATEIATETPHSGSLWTLCTLGMACWKSSGERAMLRKYGSAGTCDKLVARDS